MSIGISLGYIYPYVWGMCSEPAVSEVPDNLCLYNLLVIGHQWGRHLDPGTIVVRRKGDPED